MGFKTMPWTLYYKPSLDEFVIRQRHTKQESANVKAIHAMLEAVRGTDAAPGKVAHREAAAAGLAREKVVYVNGRREIRPVVYMPAFRAYLRFAMANVVVPVDEGEPTEKLHRMKGQRGIPRELGIEAGREISRAIGARGAPVSVT